LRVHGDIEGILFRVSDKQRQLRGAVGSTNSANNLMEVAGRVVARLYQGVDSFYY